jgi:hypothetical protein
MIGTSGTIAVQNSFVPYAKPLVFRYKKGVYNIEYYTPFVPKGLRVILLALLGLENVMFGTRFFKEENMLSLSNAVLEWKSDGSYVRIYERGEDYLKGTKSTGAVYAYWKKRTKFDKEAEMMADVLQAIVFDGVDPKEAFWELQKIIDFNMKLKEEPKPKAYKPNVRGVNTL